MTLPSPNGVDPHACITGEGEAFEGNEIPPQELTTAKANVVISPFPTRSKRASCKVKKKQA